MSKKNGNDSSHIVEKNQIVEVTIDDIGNDGEGIGKYNGYTLFIKDAVAGDVVRAKVLKTKKAFGYAKVEEIISPSPYRVTPKCELAAKCGGCQIQQISYEKQLAYKQQKVYNCFKRIGGFENPELEPIVGMEEPFHYRNKSQFPVGADKDGKPVMGFYAGRTHTIIDTSHCYIGDTLNAFMIQTVKEFLAKYDVKPYDEESHTGLVRHILTRVGATTGEVMVCVIINGKDLPYKDQLVEALKDLSKADEKYHLTSVCLNVNTEKTNVILGKKVIPVYGEAYITDYIGDIKYQISPLSFFQVNPVQTKKLYDLALEYADLHGNETVWDLYCGIGTISLFLAKQAKQVYGVEIVPEAIEDAKHNAILNQIENAEFFVGAAEEVMPRKYTESNDSMRADVIVVDPPRKGCEESLLDTIIKMTPERVVYVSCDPATLARDAKYLCEHGYEVKRIRPVDQFPHSVHVETVCLLVKSKV